MAVDEPGDFLPYGGVDEVVEEVAGVFEGEGVGVGEVGCYEGLEFWGEGCEGWWGRWMGEGGGERDGGEVGEDVFEGGGLVEAHYCGGSVLEFGRRKARGLWMT